MHFTIFTTFHRFLDSKRVEIILLVAVGVGVGVGGISPSCIDMRAFF